ncbi:hypothetical protein MJI12_25505, partial [Salmonella enterica subsp. enterica serovar Kentucky]|nr:hypothetical protein [Salmonella enterica subsp. enterica serovar Kentucky]
DEPDLTEMMQEPGEKSNYYIPWQYDLYHIDFRQQQDPVYSLPDVHNVGRPSMIQYFNHY